MKFLTDIIKSESLGGILLFCAALLAILLANSPAKPLYDAFINTQFHIQLGELFQIKKPIVLWINDGLMAIFFLLVGLEIKREIIQGKLQNPQVVILPLVGAVGGVIMPGIIYVFFNFFDPIALKGWAIPVATDIAFSLAVLNLLGKRIPYSLKIFLTALAIIDDIVAVIIIALFYTSDLSSLSLIFAGIFIVILFAMNFRDVDRLLPYIVVGILLWISVLKSGVHATLSGIVLAFAIPLRSEIEQQPSLLEKLEESLIPWVSLFVLPLFAFANSGFSLSGMSWEIVFHTATLGIIFGLVVGKQVGIFGSCWLLIKMGWAKLPEAVNWRLFYGMSILCGIGFTMSLFIGTLAFQQESSSYYTLVRFSVIMGSLISAIIGTVILASATKQRIQSHDINDR